MATLGFNNVAFAPVAQDVLDALFFQDPNLLTGEDCLLQAGSYFRRSLLSEMIQDSVLVLLQDLVVLDANNDPLPVPPGMTGKAIPAIFYQQRSSTPFTKTIVRDANLHGAGPFPATCTLLPDGFVAPPSITIPNSFNPEVYVLTSLRLDYIRSVPGNFFNPLWTKTSGATPPHPIQFLSDSISTAAVTPSAVNSAGLVTLANSNPLYPVNTSIHNKSNALQKTLFENLAFWFWWNGQNIQATLNIFGGAGNEDILCASAVDHIMSKLHKRFLLYPICRPENIKVLMRGFFFSRSFLPVLPMVPTTPFLFVCLPIQMLTEPRIFSKIQLIHY